MAKRANSPRQIARSVEVALAAYLNKEGSFKARECAVIEFSESKEAPENLPVVVVKCVNVSRAPDTSRDMYSKTANVVVTLITDSEQNNLPQYERIADNLEQLMDNLPCMQTYFNKPAVGTRDKRPIRGLHLHDVDELQTDTDTTGTQWEFGVGGSLIMDQVAS